MKYVVLERTGPVKGGNIILPVSKSLSNRLLLLRELAQDSFSIDNLSEADDTRIMMKALEDIREGRQEIHAGEAGTVARFLTAYLAWLGQEHILTGNRRLQERPIGPLVDALRLLGARIEFAGNERFLPLKFGKGKLQSGTVELAPSFSSQFFSALLMIAPLLPEGLTLKTTERPVSLPYIDMTIGLMRQGGIQVTFRPWEWRIHPGNYHFPENIKIEADWSAAAPWLVFSLWAAPVQILLQGLESPSLQGDSSGLHFFENPSFHTSFTPKGLTVSTNDGCQLPAEIHYDFVYTPDLALSFITAAAASGCRGTFTGLQTLSLKESDRFQGLLGELANLGIKATPQGNHSVILHGTKIQTIPPFIKTYNDHRMAMAFAPLVLLTGKLCLENPDSVNKSYPHFWNHLSDRGIKVTFTKYLPVF
ncbi:MAG: 3-phosphoshikimate 1-carboxyvinyltransferase [Bacteroidales bacterium]